MMKRTFRSSVISFVLLSLGACGGTTTTSGGAKPPVDKQSQNKQDADEKKLVVAAPPPVEKAEDVLPTKISSLFQFVSKDAPIIINIPRLDKLIAALDPETRDTITKELLDSSKKESTIEGAIISSLLDSYDSGVIFSDPDKKGTGADVVKESVCMAAKFRSSIPFEAVLAGKDIERNGPRFTAHSKKDPSKPVLHGVWFADSSVMIGCAKPEGLTRSLAVATGALPSYTTSGRFVAERVHDLYVSVDMHPIIGDTIEPGSDLFASLTTPGQSLGLDLRLNLYGSSFPPIGSVLAPASQSAVAQMPKGTIGAIGVSLKRAPGKDLGSVIALIDKATNGHNLKDLQQGAEKLGVQFSDIDTALGDDLAIGVYRNAKEKIDFEKTEGFKHTSFLVAIASKDESAHQKIWNALVALVKKRPKDVSIQGNAFESIPNPKNKRDVFARVESRKGFIVFAMGDKAMAKEALSKFGKDTLASSPVFSEARAKEKPAVHMLAFVDGALLKSLIPAKTDKPQAPTNGAPAFLSLLLGPTDRGLELALGGGGAMELISTGTKLALNAVKAYEADSKSSEARMNVRFISSYARRAYERENADGKGQRLKLCKSSTPVPATIPKGTTYKTNMGSGGDWDSGDDDTGWKCLDYFSNEEVRYQYEYRQGGNYKGPKRGGPNPGPNGFEVSAEGDLDGDGKTSLFTRTGKVVNGKIVLDDDVFSSDPNE